MPSTQEIARCLADDDFFEPVVGSNPGIVARKNQLARGVFDAFRERFGERDLVKAYHVPGRVEFTAGKHTDYLGLPVPNFAIDRGFFVLVSPSAEPVVTMTESGYNYPTISFRLDDLDRDTQALEIPCQVDGKGDDRWRNYPITVLKRVYDDFADLYSLGGVDIAFGSDLPPASGMSSSSALMIMTFIAFAGANDLLSSSCLRETMGGDEPRNTLENLALYLACCENGSTFKNPHNGSVLEGKSGVGTFGGSQDHVSILAGEEGILSVNDFCPIRHLEDVAWPEDLGVAVCYALPASKTAEAREGFNALRRRGDMVSEALSEWLGMPGKYDLIGDLLADHPDIPLSETVNFLRSRRDFRENRLAERWEMAYLESQVHLPRVAGFLQGEDYESLGCLTSREHAMSCVNLRNIHTLIDEAQKCALSAGAYGASGFGGGFGGSLFALVDRNGMEDFLQEWQITTRPGFEEWPCKRPECRSAPSFFAVWPSSGAREMCADEPSILSEA